jgi:hypothetical protein
MSLLGRHFQGSSGAANISETHKRSNICPCTAAINSVTLLLPEDIFLYLHSSLVLEFLERAEETARHRALGYVLFCFTKCTA